MGFFMIKGVTEKEEKIIHKILMPYRPDFDFYYYGSRVKGNFSKLSDLDILIKGNEEMPFGELSLIRTLFDASDLPYIVNFVDYNSIEPRFYELIQKDLVKIFD